MGDESNAGHCSMLMREKNFKIGGQVWISTESGQCSYECFFCKSIFATATLFEQHIPIKHIDQRQPIENPIHLLNNVGPNMHRRSSIDITRRRCSLDASRMYAFQEQSKRRESNEVLQRQSDGHCRRHVKADTDTYKCLKCDCQFRSIESLRAHNRRHHSFRCADCVGSSKTFETEKGLWSHRRQHHRKEFPYRCDVCPRSFAHRDQLKLHEEATHVRGKNVPCDFCSRILMSVFQKKNHIKRSHSNRRYHCQLCKKMFPFF